MPPKKLPPIPKYLYHITDLKSADKIMKRGLKGSKEPRNRGETLKKASIFVLISKELTLLKSVAVRQIWVLQDINDFALIRIDSAGIKGKVLPDGVAELDAVDQRIIEQDRIEPEYLKLQKIYKLKYPGGRIRTVWKKLMDRRKMSADDWKFAKRWMPYLVNFYQNVEELEMPQKNETARSKRK